MTAHTPGPWGIIQLPSMSYRIDAKVDGMHVCPAIANSLPDAHLIAAAPDLLAALEYMTRVLSGIGRGDSVVRLVTAARRAIHSAKGGVL